MDATFQEISDRIHSYLEERDWHHTPPRAIAVSLMLEAAELLEHYQWYEDPEGDTDEIAEELADILIYAFQFARRYDIDLPTAMQKKIVKTSKKYPAEKFKNVSDEEARKNWYAQKLAHKKKGL